MDSEGGSQMSDEQNKHWPITRAIFAVGRGILAVGRGLRWFAHPIKALFSASPVFVDGLLFVLMAFHGAVGVTFTSDAAYKYVDAYWLFWIKNVNAWILASYAALAGFRSKQYGEYRAKKETDAQAVIDADKKPLSPPQPANKLQL